MSTNNQAQVPETSGNLNCFARVVGLDGACYFYTLASNCSVKDWALYYTFAFISSPLHHVLFSCFCTQLQNGCSYIL